ncbi:MAG: GSU2403 family nucleotidyltransferase fold protein [Pseudomonadota bacterium]
MNDLGAFAKLVTALDPWRQQLIFIGGWAHRLHRLDPRANALDHQPVFTRDTDLAFANKEVIAGDIKTTLIEHGFQEELGGDHTPPAAHYTLGNAEGGFYAEFLTPLAGSGTRRNGKPDATILRLWCKFSARPNDSVTVLTLIRRRAQRSRLRARLAPSPANDPD